MLTSITQSFSYLAKGGIVMIPIIFCSFLALAVFIERMWTLKREKIIPTDFFNDVAGLIIKKDIEKALELCNANNSSLALIMAAGLRNYGSSKETVKEAIEETGRRETSRLDRYTGIIGTIANITPLLGLLGTVSGMIKAFNVISVAGAGDPATLAGGISEALITTASGLTVAIPAFVAYKYLLSRADSLIMEMEEYSSHAVEILKEGESKPKGARTKPVRKTSKAAASKTDKIDKSASQAKTSLSD